MRKFLLISLFALMVAGAASAQNMWFSSDTIAHNAVWKEKLVQRVEFLADTLCQGRAAGSRGGTEAAIWVMNRFRDNGLLPFSGSYFKHFRINDALVGHNVMGMLPGSRKKPCEKYLIVCAHFDHLGILGGRMYPGADSNASGVAALLSLSDMFSVMKKIGRRYGQNIIFVALDAKEMNMAGSASLWELIENEALTDPQSGKVISSKDISLVVNMDQIGSSLAPLKSGRKDYLIMLGKHTLERDDAEMLAMCNRFYGIGLELSDTYYGSEDFTKIFYGLSDHKVFAENGVPAVFFTSGITFNTFKTYDLPETLDWEVLRKRILLIFHWIEKVIG